MITTRAKSKKAAPDICPKISNKISTRRVLSVIEATRQNVLEAFLLLSNRDKLSLVVTEATFSSLAGFLSVKVPSKRHIWVSPSVASTPTKSPKVFNNKPVNKLVFLSIDSIFGAASTTFSKKMVKKTKSSKKWEQSLASTIVTLNPFVIPNEILDEISVALSGTLSKMGQDQLLAVLPNVVSSGRFSLVLKAKQFPSVGLSVLENWADQMETESSSLPVSGATSGGFAGWVASTLVSGATFKIKLAHVKAVFQLVHGFLGAKSVLKDNVKLFCMKFASQVSLKAAFLIELTSSVYLATLKIAKSLVVSESSPFPAAVALCNMPLSVSAVDIKSALGVFGEVSHIVLKPVGVWQYVVIYFKKLNTAAFVFTYWSILVSKNSVHILPFINQNKTILFCDQFKAKLVNLPPGCTAFKINLDLAVVKTSMLRKCHIWWETPGNWHCFRCQETGHLAVNCKMSLPFSSKTLRVFNAHFVGNVSYVKASAPLAVSGFPPLVASVLLALSLAVSFAVSVVNSTVKLRLDSMENQILDLSILVKFVIEPIGSLVVLVTTLLNNNAAKTLKIEKDLLTMCNASKSFTELLVGVSKNFASLKAKVEFGNLNEDNIGAAKASLLNKDTVDYAVAL
ncbi:hypothetical protein G9A89_007783 [Geosiphon pyriformis]|nr:hypothetical protein G9A89_007783 [Geosiphon pyriformis]